MFEYILCTYSWCEVAGNCSQMLCELFHHESKCGQGSGNCFQMLCELFQHGSLSVRYPEKFKCIFYSYTYFGEGAGY